MTRPLPSPPSEPALRDPQALPAEVPSAPEPPEDDGFDPVDQLAAYREYNKTLRTWFAAFGVGGPALFLVNRPVAEALAQRGALQTVALAFVSGAALQVLGALVNKVANWGVYVGGVDPDFARTRRYALAEAVLRRLWPDLLIDLGTIGAFGIAIWKLVTVFGAAPGS